MTDATNLTVRDVLEQVDRRLTRLEDDLREFRRFTEECFAALEARFDAKLGSLEARFDAKLGSLEARIDSRLESLEAKFDARFAGLEARFSALEAKVDRNFRWQLGITMASWLSVMSAILLK